MASPDRWFSAEAAAAKEEGDGGDDDDEVARSFSFKASRREALADAGVEANRTATVTRSSSINRKPGDAGCLRRQRPCIPGLGWLMGSPTWTNHSQETVRAATATFPDEPDLGLLPGPGQDFQWVVCASDDCMSCTQCFPHRTSVSQLRGQPALLFPFRRLASRKESIGCFVKARLVLRATSFVGHLQSGDSFRTGLPPA